MNSRLSRAVDLVRAFEQFEPQAVRRADGGWAIGYGHTRTAREGAVVSRADAEALLLYDLSHVAAVVEHEVRAPLNDNEFGALTAFAFNIGYTAFRRSAVVERLNAGDRLGAAQEMERWRRADGDGGVVDALVRRRAAEKIRFLTPPEGFAKTSTPVMRPALDPEVGLATPSPPTRELEAPPPPFAAEHVADSFAPPPPANESAPMRPEPATPIAAPPEPDTAVVSPPEPSSSQAPSSPLRLQAAEEAEPPPWAEPTPTEPERRRPGAPPVNPRLLAAGLGLLGVVLFAASIYLILIGKLGVGDLAVGLLGIGCMAPAVYILLGQPTASTGQGLG